MVFAEGSKCMTEVSGGEYMQFLSQEDKDKAEASQISGHNEGNSDGVDRSAEFEQRSMDLQILLCCTDVLLVYSLKSVMQVLFLCLFPISFSLPHILFHPHPFFMIVLLLKGAC